MKLSKIGWCDFSGGDLNFITGCTPVSAGCRECYGRRIYERFGRDFSKVRMHPDKLRRLERKRFPEYSPKRGAPHKPMCFPCDTGDLFHEAVPFPFVHNALDVMAGRRDVTWQVLTKRPKRLHTAMQTWTMTRVMTEGKPVDLSNIWLGVSVENQQAADELFPLLLETPATVRFVSVEPMLAPINLTSVCCLDGDHLGRSLYNLGMDAGINWVICGAESGPNRRPFELEWAEDLYEQCKAAGVPFFAKQDSGLRPGVPLLIHGREVKQWPES